MVTDIDIAEPINDNEVIWRYMDFASFYSLLYSQKLFFRRVDTFTDELEGVLPDEVKDYLFSNWSNFPLFGPKAAGEMLNEFCDHLKQFNTGTLCNCWVNSPSEIFAMWKIYLRGSMEGVAVRTTVGNLRQALSSEKDYTLAKVSYEILPWREIGYKTLPSYKSAPYSYESELRILVYDQFESHCAPIDVFPKIPLHQNGFAFEINVEKLIDQVYVSPFAGDWFSNVVKTAIVTLMPSFDENKIVTSRIKDK